MQRCSADWRRWRDSSGRRRGSIVAVTDAAGNALAINRYDEYGIPQSGNLGRFQYTGQAWLPELGLYHYKARMYSPTLGRFMQTDPIGYADGLNWYNYVGSDPVNATDPSGLKLVYNCIGIEGYEVCGFTESGGGVPASGFDLDHYLRFFDNSRYFLGGSSGAGDGGGGALGGTGDVSKPVPASVPQKTQPSVICRFVGAIFGGGKGTAQVGVAGTGQLGPGAVTGGGGVAVDRYGNVGLYSYGGGGAGMGAYVGGGASGQVSNADGIGNLRDVFVNASGSGGLGPSASADAFVGTSSKGPVVGGGVTLGGGAGIGAFGGATFTSVVPLFNIKSAVGCK